MGIANNKTSNASVPAGPFRPILGVELLPIPPDMNPTGPILTVYLKMGWALYNVLFLQLVPRFSNCVGPEAVYSAYVGTAPES